MSSSAAATKRWREAFKARDPDGFRAWRKAAKAAYKARRPQTYAAEKKRYRQRYRQAHPEIVVSKQRRRYERDSERIKARNWRYQTMRKAESPELFAEFKRRQKTAGRAKIARWYVVDLLSRTLGVSASAIPAEFIEAKAALLQIKRLLRKERNATTEQNGHSIPGPDGSRSR